MHNLKVPRSGTHRHCLLQKNTVWLGPMFPLCGPARQTEEHMLILAHNSFLNHGQGLPECESIRFN
jgi:hypothetical protein